MHPRYNNGRDILIFLLLWLCLLAAGREKMLRDPGAFWHTAVGEQILHTGSLPTHDTFSYAAEGKRWIAQQWLAEIFMALIHRLSGLDGLLLLSCTLLAVLFTSLTRRWLDAGMPMRYTAMLLVLALAASSYHFLVRPHLLTMLLMATTCTLLSDVESGRRPLRSLLILPFIMILWTNLHGGALGGLFTILAVSFGWLFAGTRIGTFDHTLRARWIGAAASACILAVLVNPYGPNLPAQWIGLMKADLLPRIIIEHAPLKLLTFEGSMILAVALVYFMLLARAWPARRAITWLVPILWFVLALSRVRHGPLFVITAAIAIAEMFPHARITQVATNVFQTLAASRRPIIQSGFLFPVYCLLIVCFAIQAAGWRIPLIGAGWARVSLDYWPVQSTRLLADKAISKSNPLRIFNDMLFGGYLIYAAPQLRVYIDDRCELHGEAGLHHYLALRANPARFDAITLYDHVNLALVERNGPLDRHLAANTAWRRICLDPSAALYERVTALPPPPLLIKDNG